MKAEAGKLKFDRPYELWLDEALIEDERTELLALSARIAVGAAQLSWDHGDPADRFIVATARTHEAVLLSGDERIRRSGLVKCIWD
jgi:PIN domain nuclease of toxin-antitoxin system